MSTTIDQNVVEIRFDNKQFERNVSTTMSTLDKLKQKLKLDDASKGLENVGSAAKKVDLTSLSKGAETAKLKFSALQVAGVTALSNITNSAVNTGKNLVKSLSVDQIMSGWDKYEKKTASIQTIMNATGKSIDEVNQYLNKLMWFSDETSYGFTDMTSALATMTASGGNIEKLVPMIMGVANATAFAGKGAAEFSRVMQYGVNQAYSLGYMQAQDWKTIEGATVNSKQLMETLIKAGEALGTIKKGQVTIQNFRSSLSAKETKGWLDKSVMEKAFGTFAEMSEKAFQMVNAGEVETASEAYEILAKKYDGISITAAKAAQEAKTFTEAIDATKDAVSSGWMKTFEIIFGNYAEAKTQWTDLANLLWDMFASGSESRNEFLAEAFDSNWDKLIKNLSEAGVSSERFEKSIQKIVGQKKLTSLIKEYGSLEEAVKSGSISSDELRKALRGVTDVDTSGLVDGLKTIKRMLDYGDTGKDVEKLQKALKDLGYDIGKFGKNKDGIDGIIGPVTEKAIKKFQKAHGLVVDGIAGPKTLAAMKKAAKELNKINVDVDELVESCDSLIDVIKDPGGRELLFDSLMNVLQATQIPLNAVKEAFGNIFSLSPENLLNGIKKINEFTEKLLNGGFLSEKTWKGLTKRIKSAGIETEDFTSALTTALEENSVNVDKLVKKYGSLGEAFEEGAISSEIIRDVLLSFDGISETLVDSGEAMDKVRRTFEGLFAAIDIVATVLSGPAKIIFKTITKILGKFGLTFLDFTANLGDTIVEMRDNVDKVVEDISDFIAEHVTKWVEKLEDSEFIKTVAGWFSDAGKKISGAFEDIDGTVEKFNATPVGKGLQTVAGAIGSVSQSIGKSKIVKNLKEFFTGLTLDDIGNGFFGVVNFISNVTTGIVKDLRNSKLLGTVVDGVTNVFSGIKDFFKSFDIKNDTLNGLRNFLTSFVDVGNAIAESGISGGFSKIGSIFSGKMTNTDTWRKFQESLQSFLTDFVSFWMNIGDKLKPAIDWCKDAGQWLADAFKSIVKFIFGTEEVDLPAIMAVVEKLLWIKLLFSSINALETLVSPFENITSAIDNFASSLKWDAIGGAFKSMALALAAFTVCVVIISQIKDMNKAWQAAGMLAGLMVVMGAVVLALGVLAGKFGGIDVKGVFAMTLSMVMLVGSIALLMYSIQEIDKIDLKDPLGTFGILAGIMVTMAGGLWILGKIAKGSIGSAAAVLTLCAALKLILEVIDSYDQHDFEGQEDAIRRMVEMLLTLSAAMGIMGLGLGKGSNFKGLALAILAMVLALKMILNMIDDIATKSDADLERGIGVIQQLMLIMTLFVAVANLTNKGTVLEKGQKNANTFTGFAFALLAVVAAIWLLGKMDMETLKQGGFAVGQILLLMTGMLAVLGKTCSGLKTGPIIAMLVAFAVLMAEMAIITKYLDGVSWESKLSTAAALSMMILAIAGVMKTISSLKDVDGKSIGKWIGIMGVLVLVIAALGFVLKSLQGIDAASALASGAALSIMIFVLGEVARRLLPAIEAINGRKLTPQKIQKAEDVLWRLVGIVAGLAAVLGIMDMLGVGGGNIVGNAVALSILSAVLIEMARRLLPAIEAIDGRKLTPQKIDKVAGLLGRLVVIVAGLALVLGVMNRFGGNGGNAVGHAVALGIMSAVLLEMTRRLLPAIEAFDDTKLTPQKMLKVAAVLLGLIGVVAALAAILMWMNKVNGASSIANAIALSALLAVMAGVLSVVSKITVNSSWGQLAKLGAVFAGLVGVLFLLGLVLRSVDDLDPAKSIGNTIMLSALIIVMTGVLSAIDKITVNSSWGQLAKLGAVFAGLVGVLFLLGLVLRSVSDLDPVKAIVDAVVLTALLVAMGVVLVALDRLNVKPNVKAVTAMAILGVVLIEIAAALAIMQNLNPLMAIADCIALGTLLVIMAGVLALLDKLHVYVNWNAMGAMAILGAVLIELSVALAIMKDLDPRSAFANAVALGLLMAALVGVLVAFDKLHVYVNQNAVTAMVILGAVLIELSVALAIMKDLDPGTAVANAGILVGLLTVLGVALWALSYIKVTADTYKGIIGIALLGLVVWEIGSILVNLQNQGLNGGAIATVGVLTAMLIVLGVALAACVVLGTVLQSNVAGAAMALVGLALLGLVVWEIGAIIANLQSQGLNSAMPTVGVLAAMLGVLTIALAACIALGLVLQAGFIGASMALVGIALLGLVVWEIGAIIANLQNQGLGSAMPTVMVLATMLGVLTIALAACVALGLVLQVGFVGASMALVGLALLGLVVWEIGAIIANLKNQGLNEAMPTVMALSTMLLTMTVILGVLSVIGLMAVPAALGMVALALLGLVVWEVGAIINSLNQNGLGDPSATVTVNNLVTILTAMTSMLVPLTIIGAMAPAAYAGIAALAVLGGFILAVGVVITAIGALMDLCPSIEDWLNNGLNLMIKLAEGIGEMISAFGTSLTEDLPAIGDNISGFANDLKSFISAVNCFDSGLLGDVTNFVKAINKLKGADIDGVIDTFENKASSVENAIKSVVNAIKRGLSNAVAKNNLVSGMSELVDTAISKITSDTKLTAAAKAGSTLAKKITSGMESSSNINSASTAGSNLGKGYIKGIEGMKSTAYWAGYILGQMGAKGIADGQQSHSPSVLGMIQGEYLGEGYAQGIDSKQDQAAESGEGLAESALGGIVDKISGAEGSVDLGGIFSGESSGTEGVFNTDESTLTFDNLYSYLNRTEESVDDSDKKVKNLQAGLSKLGYDIGKFGPNGDGIDGIFGSMTKAALKKFQKEHGLNITGELTEATMEAIAEAVKAQESAVAEAKKSATDEMLAYEQWLADNGYNVGKVDGIFDADTQTATKKFQLDYNIKVTGKFDENTKEKFEELEWEALEAAEKAADEPTTTFQTRMTEGFEEAAVYAHSGFNKRMLEYAKGEHTGVTEFAISTLNALDKTLEINSPSKATARTGSWFCKGFVNAIDRMRGDAESSAGSLGQASVDSLSSTISRISDLVNSDIDAQPTIKPVLDLSDVQSGTSALSSMLNMGSTIGVRSNLGSISSAMNLRSQNGVNADVVSAIDKLNKKMDNIQNASYTINGITYDDGSNITEAIATLVRYAKIEGRM